MHCCAHFSQRLLRLICISFSIAPSHSSMLPTALTGCRNAMVSSSLPAWFRMALMTVLSAFSCTTRLIESKTFS